MNARRRAILLGLAAASAAWMASSAPQPAAAQGSTFEYAVKAAFIPKFAAFTIWPSGEAGAGEPLHICVVGDDAVAAALMQTAPSAAGPRPVVVRHLDSLDGPADCQIVYAAGSARQAAAQTLEAVRGAPVLTITDAARGPARGMIHFIVFENRVRFHVDARQAGLAGIGLSSKLMALALSVKR